MPPISETLGSLGKNREKLLKMPTPPEELPKNAIRMTLHFNVPPTDFERDNIRVLMSGGTLTLTVNDVTPYSHNIQKLRDFVKIDVPDMKRIILDIHLSKTANWDARGDEIAEILQFCMPVVDRCAFSVQVAYVIPGQEPEDEKASDELKGSEAREEIAKAFYKHADRYKKFFILEDD